MKLYMPQINNQFIKELVNSGGFRSNIEIRLPKNKINNSLEKKLFIQVSAYSEPIVNFYYQENDISGNGPKTKYMLGTYMSNNRREWEFASYYKKFNFPEGSCDAYIQKLHNTNVHTVKLNNTEILTFYDDLVIPLYGHNDLKILHNLVDESYYLTDNKRDNKKAHTLINEYFTSINNDGLSKILLNKTEKGVKIFIDSPRSMIIPKDHNFVYRLEGYGRPGNWFTGDILDSGKKYVGSINPELDMEIGNPIRMKRIDVSYKKIVKSNL